MIDGNRLIRSILDAAEAGVAQSLEEIKNEAQRRAPVRKLFKGGGRRRFATGQVGVRNQLGSERAYFMARRVGRTREGDYIRGAPNSSAPVTSPSRRSGRAPVGGAEFREVQREPGYNVAFRLRHVKSRLVGREILGRALSDVRRGRGLHVLPGGKSGVEYGGTLRDSIEVVGPFRTMEGITGYVKASAVEHGFNYAYAQEFGTAHNAPQPYLRPSLRSMFRRIGTNQRNAIRNRLERTPHNLRITRSFLTISVKPTRSSALARIDARLASLR